MLPALRASSKKSTLDEFYCLGFSRKMIPLHSNNHFQEAYGSGPLHTRAIETTKGGAEFLCAAAARPLQSTTSIEPIRSINCADDAYRCAVDVQYRFGQRLAPSNRS